MADTVSADDAERGLGIDWTGWRTWCRLAFYSLQLLLIASLAALASLTLIDPLSAEMPLVHIGLAVAATLPMLFVLFHGWLIDFRETRFASVHSGKFLTSGYLFRKGSAADAIIYFTWAFLFLLAAVAAVLKTGAHHD